MHTTLVHLVNGSRVFVLDHVLDEETLAYTHELAGTYSQSNPLWTRAATAAATPRWLYDVTDAAFDPVRRAFDSGTLLAHWQEQLRVPTLYCSSISFFIDLPGAEPLAPHKELSGAWLSQVYIAAEDHSYTGTTVYTDDKEVLFQLPYRNNTGWLFDTGQTVMHGRAHSVPDLARFSIMIWYAELPADHK
jgi:hypothetical protein